MMLPFGEKATEQMPSVWPRRGGILSKPDAISQTRIVLSMEPDAM